MKNSINSSLIMREGSLKRTTNTTRWFGKRWRAGETFLRKPCSKSLPVASVFASRQSLHVTFHVNKLLQTMSRIHQKIFQVRCVRIEADVELFIRRISSRLSSAKIIIRICYDSTELLSKVKLPRFYERRAETLRAWVSVDPRNAALRFQISVYGYSDIRVIICINRWHATCWDE